MKNKSILLIGPLGLKNGLQKTGGIVVLFEDLLKQCDLLGIQYRVIDTNKVNYKNKLFAYIQILFAFLKDVLKVSHVSIHGTANDYRFIAPLVVFISKLLNKHVSLRKFAGNFDTIYDNSPKILKVMIAYILKRSNTVFFETKYLVDRFKIFNKNTFWFPNVREKTLITTDSVYNKKFIFIGHIREEKGIREILEVSNLLDDSYTIDLYGYIFEDFKDVDFSDYKVNYNGSLKHSEVLNTLAKYDVLLLPSYREGYPGVVIEAMSVGLPIIASNLQGIAEMTNDEMALLIEVKNIRQLQNAIESISMKNYQKMSKASKNQFDSFDTAIQTKGYLNKIGFQC